MKTADLVANKIMRLKTGYVFTYNEFGVPVALKKTLRLWPGKNRMKKRNHQMKCSFADTAAAILFGYI